MVLSPRQVFNDQRVLRITGLPMKISTWSVHSMYQPDEIQNIIQEMDKLKINILGISEARWPNSGYCCTENVTIYYSGSTDAQHKHGVAIMLGTNINRSVKGFIPISE